MEELVAEIGAAFLGAHTGVPFEAMQHPEYIGSWLQALKNDKRLVFSAASLAQKAMDFLVPELATTQTAEGAEAAA